MPGILLAIGYIALLLYIMRRMPFYARVPKLPVRVVALLFLLKVAAGVALWAVYTWVYTERVHADIFKYFDDSAIMFSALPDRPGDLLRMLFSVQNDTPYFDANYYTLMNNWYREYEGNMHNDAHTIIRFNTFVRFLSFGEFHVHTVIAAFLSLTGMLALYRTFVAMLPGRERALMIAIFLLPSVLFWASGVIKESLLFFGLGILLWLYLRMLKGNIGPLGLLVFGATGVLLFHLKFYVIASLLPTLAMLAWARATPRLSLLVRTAVVVLVFTLAGLHLHYVLPGFNVLETIAVKQRDFIGLSQATDPGSFVMPPRLEPTVWSFLQQAPYALMITLVGPLVYPAPGAFGAVAAMENAILLLAIGFLLMYRLPWRAVDRTMVVSVISFVILMALLIGWTTPVMGAVVRYRTPLLPFLFIAVLLVLDHHALLVRWPRLRTLISV